MEWDFFVSYASENRDYASKIASELKIIGLRVWFDDFVLVSGDSLSEKINLGLRDSFCGIVILSAKFFEKNWTQTELKALTQQHINQNKKLILLRHDVTQAYINKEYPLLADIKSTNADKDVDVSVIIREIIRASEKIIKFPAEFPQPRSQVLLWNDVFNGLAINFNFKKEEILNLQEDILFYLNIHYISTLNDFNALMKATRVWNILEQIYQEELLRPIDNPLDPVAIASWGAYLYKLGLVQSVIDEIRARIRLSPEYIEKHPNEFVMARPIFSGEVLVNLLENIISMKIRYRLEPHNDSQSKTLKWLFYIMGTLVENKNTVTESDKIDLMSQISFNLNKLATENIFLYIGLDERNHLAHVIFHRENSQYIVLPIFD